MGRKTPPQYTGTNSSAKLDASGKRFGLVVARWNGRITDALLAAAREALVRHGGDPGIGQEIGEADAAIERRIERAARIHHSRPS